MRPWPWRGFARPEEFPEDAIPFDALGAEFAHQGEDCTFETLLKRTGLRDRRLAQLAQIVREMALRDQKFRREEALGWIWRSGVSWRDPEGRSARAEPWPPPLRWAVYRAGGPEMLQCQVVDPLERRRASIQLSR